MNAVVIAFVFIMAFAGQPFWLIGEGACCY